LIFYELQQKLVASAHLVTSRFGGLRQSRSNNKMKYCTERKGEEQVLAVVTAMLKKCRHQGFHWS